MALNVLAYNMKRVMAIIGVVRLIEVFAVERDLRDEINPCSMPRVQLGRSAEFNANWRP